VVTPDALRRTAEPAALPLWRRPSSSHEDPRTSRRRAGRSARAPAFAQTASQPQPRVQSLEVLQEILEVLRVLAILEVLQVLENLVVLENPEVLQMLEVLEVLWVLKILAPWNL
jgi:hypothetical protein